MWLLIDVSTVLLDECLDVVVSNDHVFTVIVIIEYLNAPSTMKEESVPV